ALTAASLKPKAGWPVRLGDRPITTQPIVANGLIYVGAWDGYEYALHPDGTTAWRQYLGRTKNCFIADAVSTTTAGTVAGAVSTACEGASIWGSATVDEAAGTVYVATGNSRPCSIFGPQLGRYPHTKRGTILLIVALLGLLVAAVWPRSWVRLGFWLAATGSLLAAARGAYLLVGPTVSINRPYSVSLVQLDAKDLHVIASWKVPKTDEGDYDFGPT